VPHLDEAVAGRHREDQGCTREGGHHPLGHIRTGESRPPETNTKSRCLFRPTFSVRADSAGRFCGSR
jgi:hypothetical protein